MEPASSSSHDNSTARAVPTLLQPQFKTSSIPFQPSSSAEPSFPEDSESDSALPPPPVAFRNAYAPPSKPVIFPISSNIAFVESARSAATSIPRLLPFRRRSASRLDDSNNMTSPRPPDKSDSLPTTKHPRDHNAVSPEQLPPAKQPKLATPDHSPAQGASRPATQEDMSNTATRPTAPLVPLSSSNEQPQDVAQGKSKPDDKQLEKVTSKPSGKSPNSKGTPKGNKSAKEESSPKSKGEQSDSKKSGGKSPGKSSQQGDKSTNTKSEDMEYDSDDDEAPLDLSAISVYEYEQVAKFTPMQLRRYEQYRRSDLKNAKVKKVLLSLNPSLAKASEQYIIAVKGLAKLFVGDVVESALEVKKQLGDKGALQPKHLREAYRRLRQQGVIPSSSDKAASIG